MNIMKNKNIIKCLSDYFGHGCIKNVVFEFIFLSWHCTSCDVTHVVMWRWNNLLCSPTSSSVPSKMKANCGGISVIKKQSRTPWCIRIQRTPQPQQRQAMKRFIRPFPFRVSCEINSMWWGPSSVHTHERARYPGERVVNLCTSCGCV